MALWKPSAERIESSGLTAFLEATGHDDFVSLHRWSVAEPGAFWATAWDELGVIGERGETALVPGGDLPSTRFFPDATLNVAENLLRRDGGDAALIFRGEDAGVRRQLSWWELRRAVGRVQEAMRRRGVEPGDRIAAWMPNVPETYVVMLAAASIGATFTSTSPDFGAEGVVDRFGQVGPKMLFACDSYFYGGKVHDRLGVLDDVVRGLPTVEHVVVVPFAGSLGSVPGAATMEELVADISPREPDFVPLPFDHPWYVLFSSGTTGPPKAIVHRAGGVLLKHLVEHRLHCDVRADDRVFYFTTAGWMMWNWLAYGDLRQQRHPHAVRRLAVSSRRAPETLFKSRRRRIGMSRYSGPPPSTSTTVGEGPGSDTRRSATISAPLKHDPARPDRTLVPESFRISIYRER